MTLMAYCPLDEGQLIDHPILRTIAARHDASAAQVALAWLMAQPGVMAIPKAVHALHLRQNWQAQHVRLDALDCEELARHFPRPRSRQPLAMR